MPRPALILTDQPTATQTPFVAPSPPPTSPSSPTSPTGKFRYLSYHYAKKQLQAHADANGRGAVLRALDLYQELKHLADRHGHVRTTNDQLAKVLKVKSRMTVFSAAKRLVQAGLIDPPRRTYDRRGYVNGLDYTVRFDPAYVQVGAQQELPFKSRNSSARGAPRPPDPATDGHVQKAAYAVTDPLRADVPETRPDQAEAVRTWLAGYQMTASESQIRAGLDYVARERRRQQRPLLISVVARGQARPVARRATNGGAGDLTLNDAWNRFYAAQEAASETGTDG